MTTIGASTSGIWNDLRQLPQTPGVSADTPASPDGLAIPLPASHSNTSSAGVSSLVTDTRLTLSSMMSIDDPVYAKPVPTQPAIAWASDPADELSLNMLSNVAGRPQSAQSASSLLNGLGAKLLERFSTTQDDFKQSIVAYKAGFHTAYETETTSVNTQKLAEGASNRVDFSIQTQTGKTVHISIAYGLDGQNIESSLNVEAQVEGGKLTDAEQQAVAKLASGFETALRSATQGKVDVSGLLDYDATALSSVDLSLRQTPQDPSEFKSFDFHADAKKRSLSTATQDNQVSLAVDLSRPTLWGSPAQQQTAVQNYLTQFDKANQRGHGDAALLREFKDVFSQLHSKYPATNTTRQSSPLALDDKDLSVLTGLADFTASMSGSFHHGSTEAGHLDYQLSQHSEIVGKDKQQGLSFTQNQTAHLKSAFQSSRNGAMLDIKSGNYDTTTIDDQTSSTTSVEYAELKLKKATVTEVVNRLEQWKKLVNHKAVEQRDTPENKSNVQDISARLSRLADSTSNN